MAILEQHHTNVLRPGWYPDPDQEHNLRYFDGTSWTGHVTHYGPSPCSGCCYTGEVSPSI